MLVWLWACCNSSIHGESLVSICGSQLQHAPPSPGEPVKHTRSVLDSGVPGCGAQAPASLTSDWERLVTLVWGMRCETGATCLNFTLRPLHATSPETQLHRYGKFILERKKKGDFSLAESEGNATADGTVVRIRTILV